MFIRQKELSEKISSLELLPFTLFASIIQNVRVKRRGNVNSIESIKYDI